MFFKNNLILKPYFVVFFLVLLIFLISANRAWFYHRVIDGEFFVMDYPKAIPFMWQYDLDASSHLSSAAFFPDYYKYQPTSISRPTMHFSANLIGKVFSFISSPILKTSYFSEKLKSMGNNFILQSKYLNKINIEPIELVKKIIYAAAGYILLKLFLYFLSGILLYRLLKNYFTESISITAVALLFFSGYSINAIGTYHTYELQFISPIIIVYLFHKLIHNYSLKINILFSVVVGILMLGRANYAVYLAILLFSFLFFKPKKIVITAIIISIIAHLIPWFLWNIFLEMRGMSIIGIYNIPHPETLALHPADIIGRKIFGYEVIGGTVQPGAFIVENIINLDFLTFLKIAINNFLQSFRYYGTILGFLAAVALPIFQHKHKKGILAFLLIFMLTIWIQQLFSFPISPKHRLMMDPIFLIYGFSSYTIFYIIKLCFPAHRNKLIITFVSTFLFFNIINFAKLPWIHPFDQKGQYILEK